MQGHVFFIVRPGQHDEFGHPNAVVLQLEPNSYLCVAGMTPGKPKYEQARMVEHKNGIFGPAFAVEIDHKKHLTPISATLELHGCGYICQSVEVMTREQLQAGREWGILAQSAIREIAQGLLLREGTRAFLPRKAIAPLKALARV